VCRAQVLLDGGIHQDPLDVVGLCEPAQQAFVMRRPRRWIETSVADDRARQRALDVDACSDVAGRDPEPQVDVEATRVACIAARRRPAARLREVADQQDARVRIGHAPTQPLDELDERRVAEGAAERRAHREISASGRRERDRSGKASGAVRADRLGTHARLAAHLVPAGRARTRRGALLPRWHPRARGRAARREQGEGAGERDGAAERPRSRAVSHVTFRTASTRGGGARPGRCSLRG
jgi:hypothetical protein